MKIDPIPSRLGFVAAGRSAFDFVTESPYSLWLTDQDEGRIGYEGIDIALVVLHDLMSYELDIALWRLSVEEEIKHPFGLADMIRVVDPDKANSYRQYSAANEELVRHGVAELASDFRHYGLPALTGAAGYFRQLSAARAEAIQQLGTDLRDRSIRESAEQAWLHRDFQRVVDAYGSMEDRLSRIERGRLRYAMKRTEE